MAKITNVNVSEMISRDQQIGLSFLRMEGAHGGSVVYPITEDGIPIAGVRACEVASKLECMTVMTLTVLVCETTADKAAKKLLKNAP